MSGSRSRWSWIRFKPSAPWALLRVQGLDVTEMPQTVAERPASSTTKLALLSTRGSESYGYHIVEGQARNISSDSLQNVARVSKWLDKGGESTTTANALIVYTPTLPGQTPP